MLFALLVPGSEVGFVARRRRRRLFMEAPAALPAAPRVVVPEATELLLDLVHGVAGIDRRQVGVEGDDDRIPAPTDVDPAAPPVGDTAQDPFEPVVALMSTHGSWMVHGH